MPENSGKFMVSTKEKSNAKKLAIHMPRFGPCLCPRDSEGVRATPRRETPKLCFALRCKTGVPETAPGTWRKIEGQHDSQRAPGLTKIQSREAILKKSSLQDGMKISIERMKFSFRAPLWPQKKKGLGL